nr:hypothetical protein [Bacteroidota bacterium]
KHCCTHLVLKNPKKNTISNISLVIKNAETTKKAKLTGSDDGENWFAIKEEFYFHGINNRESTMELKSIEFPPSNYEFYSLLIDDSSAAPLNIFKAGFYETETETGAYTKLTGLAFIQADSSHIKKSYIKIEFPSTVLLDKIDFRMEGPAYFQRNVRLMVKQERILKKGKKVTTMEPLQAFSISSTKQNSFFLPAIKVDAFYVEIENLDAPALTVKEVNAFQLNRYLVAFLEKGQSYSIKISEKTLSAPKYDIAYFMDSIPSDAPILNATKIIDFSQEKKFSEASFFTNKHIIWVAIILVILILGLLSVKLLRETSSK